MASKKLLVSGDLPRTPGLHNPSFHISLKAVLRHSTRGVLGKQLSDVQLLVSPGVNVSSQQQSTAPSKVHFLCVDYRYGRMTPESMSGRAVVDIRQS